MAQGIVKAQQGRGSQAACPELRRRSRFTNREVRDIAKDLVLTFHLSSSVGDVR